MISSIIQEPSLHFRGYIDATDVAMRILVLAATRFRHKIIINTI
jgi:hypothetical protein